MKIFVITLKNANSRQAKIAQQLNKIHVDFEFFYGVDGRLPDAQFQNYSETKRLRAFGNTLTKTQLGCFASHYKMWQKCLELNEPIIILEDDIFLSSDFGSKLGFVETELFRLQFLRLCGLTLYRKNVHVSDGVVMFTKGVSGTQGYALTPETARKFIQNANYWLEPVDDYIDKSWRHGVPSYCMIPCIVKPNDDEPSHMIKSAKQKAKLLYRITREIYRLYSEIRRLIFNLTFTKN